MEMEEGVNFGSCQFSQGHIESVILNYKLYTVQPTEFEGSAGLCTCTHVYTHTHKSCT